MDTIEILDPWNISQDFFLNLEDEKFLQEMLLLGNSKNSWDQNLIDQDLIDKS